MPGRRESGPEPSTVASRAEVITTPERNVPGFLAALSDFILANSQLPVLLGAVTSVSLLGYHIAERAEALKEITDLPLLGFRTSYTPQAVYELFDDLGQKGQAEYQYVNMLSTGAFPALIATCFSVAIGQLFKKAGLPHEWNLLPLLYLAMATMENMGTAFLLYIYPEVQMNTAAALGIVAGFRFRVLTYMSLSVLFGAVWLAKRVVQRTISKKQD